MRLIKATLGFIHTLLGQGEFKPYTNLSGDRDIERSWIISRLPHKPLKVLDLGSGPSGILSLAAAEFGCSVIAVDIGPIDWPYVHQNFKFLRGDILNTKLPSRSADLIISCSVIEHIGLTGRYGNQDRNNDGDIKTMRVLKRLLKNGGEVLLTIPIGQDATFYPYHRVYGEIRLPKLFDGFKIKEENYWIKNRNGKWGKTGRKKALTFPASEKLYGLGLFRLEKL